MGSSSTSRRSRSSASSNSHFFDFPIVSADSGFTCVTTSPTIIESNRPLQISFRARATAITTTSLADKSSAFRGLLSEYELGEYRFQTRRYRGGLDIPYFVWGGVNMDVKTDRNDLVEWAGRTRNWKAKIEYLATVLAEERSTNVDLSGSLIVRGMPGTKVNLFVKYGKIVLKGGREVKVLSAGLADLVAVSVHGEVLDTFEPRLTLF